MCVCVCVSFKTQLKYLRSCFLTRLVLSVRNAPKHRAWHSERVEKLLDFLFHIYRDGM